MGFDMFLSTQIPARIAKGMREHAAAVIGDRACRPVGRASRRPRRARCGGRRTGAGAGCTARVALHSFTLRQHVFGHRDVRSAAAHGTSAARPAGLRARLWPRRNRGDHALPCRLAVNLLSRLPRARTSPSSWTSPRATRSFATACATWKRVNRTVLAYRPTLRWLRQFSAPELHIVDVGSGGGDMLRRIEEWARRRLLTVQLTGIDLNPYATRAAREFTRPFQPHPVGHLRCLLLPSRAACRHHHQLALYPPSGDAEIVRFLQWMEQTAVRGWFINDLSRSRVSYRPVQAAGAPHALASIRAARWPGLHSAQLHCGGLAQVYRRGRTRASADPDLSRAARPALRLAGESDEAMSCSQPEALVLGGGPAGAALAMHLARSGRSCRTDRAIRSRASQSLRRIPQPRSSRLISMRWASISRALGAAPIHGGPPRRAAADCSLRSAFPRALAHPPHAR